MKTTVRDFTIDEFVCTLSTVQNTNKNLFDCQRGFSFKVRAELLSMECKFEIDSTYICRNCCQRKRNESALHEVNIALFKRLSTRKRLPLFLTSQSLNVIMSQISKWSSLNKLTIHPSRTEAMILAKQQFIGPLQPLHFGPGFVKLVNSTSCLGVTIDNKLSWHSQVDVVKASFSKKIGALRRMSYLPKLTLEEIYFKTIIPIITYGISV